MIYSIKIPNRNCLTGRFFSKYVNLQRFRYDFQNRIRGDPNRDKRKYHNYAKHNVGYKQNSIGLFLR